MSGGRDGALQHGAARGAVADGEQRDRGHRGEGEQAGEEEREAQARLHRAGG